MNIFHVTDRLPKYHNTWGGAEQAAYRLIELACQSKEYNITVLGTKPAAKTDNSFTYLTVKSVEYYVGEKWGIYATGIKNRWIPIDPISFFHFNHILRRHRPDLIHFHKFNILSFSLIQSAARLNIPMVISIYDYWYFCPGIFMINLDGRRCDKYHGEYCRDCRIFSDFESISKLFLKYRKPMFDFFLEKFAAFIVLSGSSSNILQNYGIPQDKIRVIPQVFPVTKQLDSEYPVEKNSILFTGWMNHNKGLHIIIQAMPEVLKAVPETKLCILELVAQADYKKMILELIKKERIEKSIVFLQRQSPEKFKNTIKKANVIVVPEQWENMSPVIVAEAMSLGKSIVASRIGGIPEFIQDGRSGYLAAHNDPHEFAQKIIRLLKEPDHARAMGDMAHKEAVRIFNKQTIKQKMKELYAQLLI